MTQSIIPGCEANPDPTTVINVDPTKPMKEIPMDELKRDCDTDKKMQDSFDTLLVSSANAAENGKELLEENKRLNEECEQLVRRNHELYDEVEQLRSANEDLTADNQVLKDELEEQRAKPSGLTLRSVLEKIRANVEVHFTRAEMISWAGPSPTFDEECWRSSGKCGNDLIKELENSQFVDGKSLLEKPVAEITPFGYAEIVNASAALTNSSVIVTVNI